MRGHGAENDLRRIFAQPALAAAVQNQNARPRAQRHPELPAEIRDPLRECDGEAHPVPVESHLRVHILNVQDDLHEFAHEAYRSLLSGAPTLRVGALLTPKTEPV